LTAVLPHTFIPEDVIRACNVFSKTAMQTALRIQGDELAPFRLVCAKARRFSVESNKFLACQEELFKGTEKAKLVCLVGPAGSGKTTLLAELCVRNHVSGTWV
jgi:flagellar biosynthesis GTPase FlhF